MVETTSEKNNRPSRKAHQPENGHMIVCIRLKLTVQHSFGRATYMSFLGNIERLSGEMGQLRS